MPGINLSQLLRCLFASLSTTSFTNLIDRLRIEQHVVAAVQQNVQEKRIDITVTFFFTTIWLSLRAIVLNFLCGKCSRYLRLDVDPPRVLTCGDRSRRIWLTSGDWLPKCIRGAAVL